MKIPCICLLILIIIFLARREPFATRRGKAQSVFEWFNANPSPTYTKYKVDFHNTSNVVEYEDALRLYQGDAFSVDAVQKII